MTSPAGPASPADHGFYRDAARCEFEAVVAVSSAALECELVCWLVALELQAFEEVLARLRQVPAGVRDMTIVMHLPSDLDADAVLEIEIIFPGESGQETGEAGLERSGT